MDTKEVLSLTEINAKIPEYVCFFLLGKLDRNNLYPRPEMLDQATMKLSVQIPKSENPDNREPREIADIIVFSDINRFHQRIYFKCVFFIKYWKV